MSNHIPDATKMVTPKEHAASGSVDRPVGLSACPECGAEASDRISWECGTYKDMNGPNTTYLCNERKAHNETQKDLKDVSLWLEQAEKKLSSVYKWIERNHPDGFIDSETYVQNLDRVRERLEMPNVEVTGDPLEPECDAGMFVI